MHVGQKLQVVKVKKHYPIIGSCVMCKGLAYKIKEFLAHFPPTALVNQFELIS